jgi:hypothetical protein
MSEPLSQNERLYVKKESAYATVPTFTGANCCRHTEFDAQSQRSRIDRQDKTGSLSSTVGISGRRNGPSFRVSMDLAGNGAAGVKPDCDPFLEAAFGAAGVIVAATSVTYSLADTSPTLSVASFRTPSTVNQRIAAGCVVNQLEFNWG